MTGTPSGTTRMRGTPDADVHGFEVSHVDGDGTVHTTLRQPPEADIELAP